MAEDTYIFFTCFMILMLWLFYPISGRKAGFIPWTLADCATDEGRVLRLLNSHEHLVGANITLCFCI